MNEIERYIESGEWPAGRWEYDWYEIFDQLGIMFQMDTPFPRPYEQFTDPDAMIDGCQFEPLRTEDMNYCLDEALGEEWDGSDRETYDDTTSRAAVLFLGMLANAASQLSELPCGVPQFINKHVLDDMALTVFTVFNDGFGFGEGDPAEAYLFEDLQAFGAWAVRIMFAALDESDGNPDPIEESFVFPHRSAAGDVTTGFRAYREWTPLIVLDFMSMFDEALFTFDCDCDDCLAMRGAEPEGVEGEHADTDVCIKTYGVDQVLSNGCWIECVITDEETHRFATISDQDFTDYSREAKADILARGKEAADAGKGCATWMPTDEEAVALLESAWVAADLDLCWEPLE